MDTLDCVKAFVATAQTGSFTEAANQLGISNRLTSKYVAELETRLGVRLLQRTTRRVGTTPAGEEFLARAPALLDEFDDLLSEVSESSMGFAGVIRISAPVTFGEIYVAGMLARFAAKNPNLTIDLRLDDRYVDLASDGIDIAFRIGTPAQLTVMARKLGTMQTSLVASPDYLARFGTPQSPDELSNHVLILDSNRRNPRQWTLIREGVKTVINAEGRYIVNSARAAAERAVEGTGIAFTPRFAIHDALASGELVVVLPDYSGVSVPVSAVYLEGRSLPRKVSALMDFAQADIRSADIM